MWYRNANFTNKYGDLVILYIFKQLKAGTSYFVHALNTVIILSLWPWSHDLTLKFGIRLYHFERMQAAMHFNFCSEIVCVNLWIHNKNLFPKGVMWVTWPHFYRATLYVSAVFAVARCLSVCLSICHVRAFYPDGGTYRQTSLSAR